MWDAPENEKFKKANVPVAVLLEGKFQSLFSNRLSQSENDTLQKYNSVFLQQCINDNKMIVVADGDIILNSVVKGNQAIPMGMNPFTYGSQREFAFANKDFCRTALITSSILQVFPRQKQKIIPSGCWIRKKWTNKTTWQLVNIGVPVLLVFLFAVIYQFLRKKIYPYVTWTKRN